MGYDVSGKRVLVTGASAGIGAALAEGFAERGAVVGICARREGLLADVLERCRAYSPESRMWTIDLADLDGLAVFAAQVEEDLGRVDVLVNNAGGGFHASFLDVSPNGQRALVDENFTSVTHFVRGCVPLMTNGGSIVNITSIEAHRAAPGFGVYAAMKAAVESLTKTLALELASRRIRVNAVAPDAMPTPGDEGLADAVSRGQRDAYDRKVPLGWGNVDDAAGAVVYLASDLARWVTGTVLHVDGGSHAASGWVRRDDGTYEP